MMERRASSPVPQLTMPGGDAPALHEQRAFAPWCTSIA